MLSKRREGCEIATFYELTRKLQKYCCVQYDLFWNNAALDFQGSAVLGHLKITRKIIFEHFVQEQLVFINY
jgi:hypothetical protein